MRFLYIVLFFLCTVSTTQAAFLYEQELPSEVYVLDAISGETIYGALKNAPHTFSFVVTKQTPFSMQVAMSPHEKKHDVSLILVKEVKRGVTEIGRSNTDESHWKPKYDFLRALVMLWGDKYEYSLEPGVYTLEVSAPENNRGYRLVLGEGNTSPYNELRYVRKVFEVDFLSIFFSPLIFLPIFFLLSLIFVWRHKKKAYG